MNKEKALHGIFVSLVTPFVDDRISFDFLASNIERLNTTGIQGYLALGGNGEYQCLSNDEQMRVLKFVNSRKAEKKLICGVANESTCLTIEQIKKVADTGCDLVRVMPPHYFASRMGDEVLIRYYEEIADHSPVAVVLYNVPKLTGVDLSPAAVARLALHPKIVGIKDSSAGGIYGILAMTRSLNAFDVLAGSVDSFFPALISGAVGGDMSLANYLPEACCKLQSAVESADLNRARELHLSLSAINRIVSGHYGVPGVKAAMDLCGYNGGEPRRPFVKLTAEEIRCVETAIQSEGFA